MENKEVMNKALSKEQLEKVSGGENVAITPFHVKIVSGWYKGAEGVVHTEVTGSDVRFFLVHLDEKYRNKQLGGNDPMISEEEFIIG